MENFNLLLNLTISTWFEKPDYVTKKVEFNTFVPKSVTSSPNFIPFQDFDFNLTLFEIYLEVDMKITRL
jgi:hypothetical protein